MELSTDIEECYDGIGNRLATYTKSKGLTTNLSFEAVVTDTHKNLCTIEVE